VVIDLSAGVASGGDAEGDTLTSVENLLGSGFDDALTGNSLSQFLDGGIGNDTLAGSTNADTLIGGLGNDTLDGGVNPEGISGQGDVMLGGDGDDTYHVDSGLDLVDEGSFFPIFGFGGTDTIISTTDFYWDIASVGENLIVSEDVVDVGGDGVTVVGGIFDNTITGHSGIDIMFGRGGSDTYRGGDGINWYSLSLLGLTEENAYVGVDGPNTVILDERESGLFSYHIIFEFESGKDKVDASDFAVTNSLASGDDVLARGFDDGFGNSFYILGDGLDYLYMVGVEKADMAAGDFIV
jgi:Ca2+-binding RTX toxin-like protein